MSRGRVEVKFYTFFNLGWEWVINITPRPPYSGVRDHVGIIQEAEWTWLCRWMYRYALRKDVSVNDGPHIRWWSHNIGCPTRYQNRNFFNILPLAGGPLLRVATIRHTTDTHYRHTLQTHTTDTHYRHIPLHFSHNERTPFNVLLTVHHAMILSNCPTWCTNSF